MRRSAASGPPRVRDAGGELRALLRAQEPAGGLDGLEPADRGRAAYERFAPEGPVLDFGSATGELRQVLKPRGDYHFVEQNDVLVKGLQRNFPDAKRVDGNDLGQGRFAAGFALDSLEHNEEIGPILSAIARSLRPDGVFILSGPTENVLYRLGRRLAGFDGTISVYRPSTTSSARPGPTSSAWRAACSRRACRSSRSAPGGRGA